jgi:hypothetical protein
MYTRRILIVAAVVLSSANLLFSQEAVTTKTQGQAPQETYDAKTDGKIVSVDAMARILVLKTVDSVQTFSVEYGAKVMLGMIELSKESTLGDLQTDAVVTVTWHMVDNKKIATKIVQKSDSDTKWKKGMP